MPLRKVDNEAVATPPAVPQQSAAPASALTAKPLGKPAATKTGSDTMSKAEWAAKDKRISRAGVWQAAVQSTAALQFNAAGTIQGFLAVVEQIAEKGLQFVNRE